MKYKKDKIVLTSQINKAKATTIIRRIEQINLNRFIKPCNFTVVRSNGLIRSYENIIPLVENDKISLMNLDILIKELKLIRKDVLELSNQRIMLEDLNTSNVIVHNNKIYLYDVSHFISNTDYEYTSNYNDIRINELFGETLLIKENDDISKNIISNKLYSKFLGHTNSYIEDYIKENVHEDNLRLYLKKN